jgi:hypothetical protein
MRSNLNPTEDQPLRTGKPWVHPLFRPTYWRVRSPFKVFAYTGEQKPAGFYGASQVYSPGVRPLMTKRGDEIHHTAGGDWLVRKDRKTRDVEVVQVRLTQPRDPFLRTFSSDSDNWPLDRLTSLHPDKAAVADYGR